ncbi:transposase [Bacillus velezensis]
MLTESGFVKIDGVKVIDKHMIMFDSGKIFSKWGIALACFVSVFQIIICGHGDKGYSTRY